MGPILGRLVQRHNAEVVLEDVYAGNRWSLNSVSYVMGGFGYKDEGAERLPRAWVFSESGEVVIAGEFVLIFFQEGKPTKPIIMGGLRSGAANDFLTVNHNRQEGRENRIALRVRALDANGAETGDLRIEGNPHTEGELRIGATHQIALHVSDDVGALAGVRVVVGPSGVVVSKGGNTEAVLLADTFLGDLQTWAQGLTAFLATASTATTAAQIAAGAATLQPIHAQFVAQLAIATSTGQVYKAQTLEGE